MYKSYSTLLHIVNEGLSQFFILQAIFIRLDCYITFVRRKGIDLSSSHSAPKITQFKSALFRIEKIVFDKSSLLLLPMACDPVSRKFCQQSFYRHMM